MLVLVGSLPVFASCREPEQKQVCPRASASFLFEVQAEGGVLPKDLTLVVGFGGSSKDSYSLKEGNSSAAELCCRPLSAPIPDGQPLPNNPCKTGYAGPMEAPASPSLGMGARDASPDGGRLADGGSPPMGSTIDAGEGDATTFKQEGDAGAEEADEVQALVCELWSNGAAELRIEGGPFPPLERTLQATRSEDPGLERCPNHITKHGRLMLRLGDAGVAER